MSKPKINEELVEEIAKKLIRQYEEQHDYLPRSVAKFDRVFVINLIARICQAILDGDLDEALGVVGRGVGRAHYYDNLKGTFATWTEGFKVDNSCKDKDLEFIALCREEEKDEQSMVDWQAG